MATVKNLGKTEEYVYDISLDGTFIDALTLTCDHNTDGFNFKMPSTFRYTDEHPYISNGEGRNSVNGQSYTLVEADVAEFEDTFLNKAYNGGINKSGLGVDEYCTSTINFSRKNYADFMPNGSTKKVGNTIKSRKMSGYLERFIDRGVDLLLHNQGHQFLIEYYDYIEKIYNYQIPIREIASKGNIKKTLAEYKSDVLGVTKSGSKKSRQAWYELAIREGLDVHVGDTVYYINTGVKKSQGDVKRIVHYAYQNPGANVVDVTKEVEKERREIAKRSDVKETGLDIAKRMYGPSAYTYDEIILNCKLVPNEILDKEEDTLCSDVEDLEYNVEKYIEQFNKRITPLLVCFSKDIRDNILVSTPVDRKYFTEEEAKLVSGEPMKEGDQDTFEALMTPEGKEIEFWLSIGERPPFVEECDIDWDELVAKHLKEKEDEENAVFKTENEKYLKALEELKRSDVDAFENEGKLPSSITSIMTLGSDMRLYFKSIPAKTPSTGGYVFDDISVPDSAQD